MTYRFCWVRHVQQVKAPFLLPEPVFVFVAISTESFSCRFINILSCATLTNFNVSRLVGASNCPKKERINVDSCFDFDYLNLFLLIGDLGVSVFHQFYKASIFCHKRYMNPLRSLNFIHVEGIGNCGSFEFVIEKVLDIFCIRL